MTVPQDLIERPKLTDLEQQALFAWHGTCEENNVLSFDIIANWSRVPRPKVRRVVRSLARKGLVEITTGFSDEGMIMGRGYMPTPSGYAVLTALQSSEQSK